MASGDEAPPYYILISHNALLSSPVPASTSLSHPIIEYHYADDSPHSLLPQFPGEHVLVLDCHSPNRPLLTVQSLSTELAATGVKVSDAPGAGVADDEPNRNDKMYILETTTLPEEKVEEDDYQTPHDILARFKQRNMVLRRALDYPEPPRQQVPVISPPTLPPKPS
ncbi:hypothetical protein B0H21DRAFT_822605 [Amylocystis lapponica]|nr:hypothetical protein B0H21DRAFT_822605 [Amylocystis lapponica]